MNIIYPAIFHKENDTYWVEFPDLVGCQTFGETLNETLFCAKEALELYTITLLEQQAKLNPPSDIKDIQVDENSFVTLICGDIDNYFKNDKAVKKTLTIPSWLNDLAEKEGINFSKTLQNALMEKLHVKA